MPDLLLELQTEELPASYLDRAIEQYRAAIAKRLVDLRLVEEPLPETRVRVTGTPRRVAIHVSGLRDAQPGQAEELTGPPASAAFKDGKPTKAAESFAAKVGVPLETLELRDTPKGKYLFGTKRSEGKPALAVLPEALVELIRTTEFPKSMVWVAGSKLRFARPLRGILALFGTETIPLEWNGVKSGRNTSGHPFLAPGGVELRSASWDEYTAVLRDRKVIVDRDERREIVRRLVAAQAGGAAPNEDVVKTVANLVELPEVMTGEFDAKYLEIPAGVIVAAIQGHLRAFPIASADRALADRKLTNRFAFVANRPGNPTIRAGNERVLRARLSDAHFFFTKDQKTPLVELAPRLKDMVFQDRLGSYAEKQDRVAKIAREALRLLGSPELEATVTQAAGLMKADLLTEVVGEFPELQGEIGSVYAHRQGLPAAVADAIREAYQPKSESDALPASLAGTALSIAEKLDNAVSAFATGMKPTGSKDPLGVRRQIIGVLRMLETRAASLEALVSAAASALPDSAVAPKKKPDPKAPAPDLAAIRAQVAKDVLEYAKGRLVTLAEERVRTDDGRARPDLVAAVLASGLSDLRSFWARVDAIRKLSRSSGFAPLATLVERTKNITKGHAGATPSAAALVVPAEKDLFAVLESERPKIVAHVAAGRFEDAGAGYAAAFAAPVERFMKEVFVNDPDVKVKENRLSLLRAVYALLAERFADLSLVAGEVRS